MSDCSECAALRAEVLKLKKQVAQLEAAKSRPASPPAHFSDGALIRADIERRTLPPTKPRGPQC
jgi:hypothetical protein